MKVLFHGAGSANLGGAQLLKAEVQMPPGAVVVTNSRGGLARAQLKRPRGVYDERPPRVLSGSVFVGEDGSNGRKYGRKMTKYGKMGGNLGKGHEKPHMDIWPPGSLS